MDRPAHSAVQAIPLHSWTYAPLRGPLHGLSKGMPTSYGSDDDLLLAVPSTQYLTRDDVADGFTTALLQSVHMRWLGSLHSKFGDRVTTDQETTDSTDRDDTD